jgi:signal transduction histidine kinase
MQFLKHLEKRAPLDALMARFAGMFEKDSTGLPVFTPQAFNVLLEFLHKGDASFQGAAVQAGFRWSSSAQKVTLRNRIQQRGFLTPSCLWTYRELRGHVDELFKDYASPEMGFMQIVLLKETDPARAIPYLIERFLTRQNVPEELRTAARLGILRLLDSGVAPDLIKNLQRRYPGVEILSQWQPAIPGRGIQAPRPVNEVGLDFHQLIGSVHDMKEFSSLTRTVYLVCLFCIPLSEKEWRSLWLSRTDRIFFERLMAARIVESCDGGFALSADGGKQVAVKKFLYQTYYMARESVSRNRVERLREERERRVRTSELDRQALGMVSEGIVCVDGSAQIYYMNPAAEQMLTENGGLKSDLFGEAALEDALREYSREKVLARIVALARDNQDKVEIFGDRVAVTTDGKRFEVELGPQVIVLRDSTDQYLIDQEVGKLYRHELKAALEVMGAGIASVGETVRTGNPEEALKLLHVVEQKRGDLSQMLEERIDFIRIHSDSFQVRPDMVNLNLVIDKCVSDYREAAAAKNVTIASNHLETPILTVRGEERFLVRAFENILRNAVRFSDEGSTITITMGSEAYQARVAVQDTGPGIPPENLGKIFKLGFTTGGTGRGLYLARRIVVAHQGRIDVRSRFGQGACFSVVLPIEAAEAKIALSGG